MIVWPSIMKENTSSHFTSGLIKLGITLRQWQKSMQTGTKQLFTFNIPLPMLLGEERIA